MPTVECNNVSISYITGDLKAIGLKEFVMRKLTGKYHVEEFWADKDITFSLNKGDMLGIIGSNGAGKSTLLKAVTGILRPAKGSIKTNGDIAALLELASGFDGDMTVRENTYLRGAMLGYTKEFLDSMYDNIIDFAELSEFQDYQFKHLSSGMKSRLAFSIACLVNPDIIILDEVLSVGDGAFQKKSGNKMREILSQGNTGILVSHSISQVRELCNKILWLDHGNQIVFTEDTQTACDAYEEFMITKKLPSDEKDINQMAAAHLERTYKERQRIAQKELKKFKGILATNDETISEEVVEISLDILRSKKPEALSEAYKNKTPTIE